MHIEPFNPDETTYRQLVDVHNTIWSTNPTTVEQWRHSDDNRKADLIYKRYVAIVDGRIAAWGNYGQSAWSYQPGKFGLYGGVHPDYRNRGIGTALYNRLSREAVAHGATKFLSEAREDQMPSRDFLEKRGFSQVMRYPISELDSGRFQLDGLAPRLQRVQESGIVVKTLAELKQEDSDWKQKAYDLEWKLAADVPSPDPLTPPGLDHYDKNVLQHPAFMPEAYFVALDGDEYVGMSNLWRVIADPRRLDTGLTGVVRSHRRRGIATALKVSGIRFAQAYGNAVIETGNEENNPMYQLNLQLGFEPRPAWLDYAKQLQAD